MENKYKHIIGKSWTNISRFVLAVVFIFSGFVKAVDPIGTQYKISDYLTSFGFVDAFPPLVTLALSISLSVLEFTLGAYLLFGIRRRISTTLVLMVMSVMTPLTLYLLLYHPLPDCGCFGDAIVLSNEMTFAKNLFLLVFAVTVFRNWQSIFQLASDSFQWIISLYIIAFVFVLSLYCLDHLPILDFRPYHVEADIQAGRTIPADAKRDVYKVSYVMEKNGTKKIFTLDNYPDSTWTFIERKDKLVSQGYRPPISNFDLLCSIDNTEKTDSLLADTTYTFLLVAHDMKETDDSNIDLINDIYDYCLKYNYRFYCLTASQEDQIDAWRDKSGAEYRFYLGDDVMLKTMIRSNPGLLLMKNGVVLNKWSNNDLPTEYELNAPLEQLPLSKSGQSSFLSVLNVVLAWFFIPLLLICTLDNYLIQRKKKRNNLS